MTQHSTTTRADLVVLARTGDKQAVEELMQEFLSEARGSAWSYSQSCQIEVEDLMQDIALRMCRYWGTILSPSTQNPYAYAGMVARSVLINHYRKVVRRRRIATIMPLVEGWGC